MSLAHLPGQRDHIETCLWDMSLGRENMSLGHAFAQGKHEAGTCARAGKRCPSDMSLVRGNTSLGTCPWVGKHVPGTCPLDMSLGRERFPWDMSLGRKNMPLGHFPGHGKHVLGTCHYAGKHLAGTCHGQGKHVPWTCPWAGKRCCWDMSLGRENMSQGHVPGQGTNAPGNACPWGMSPVSIDFHDAFLPSDMFLVSIDFFEACLGRGMSLGRRGASSV